MSDTRYRNNLIVGLVLFMGFIVIGVAFRFLVYPDLKADLVSGTGSESQYDHVVTMNMDSFSGYAALRSPRFDDNLRSRSIKVKRVDDGADYGARLKALKRGNAQFAVFTIDALLKSSADLGDTPATIISIIDETAGADAIVAYKSAVPDLRTLDDSSAKLVLTEASPSEFLGRVAIAEFGLKSLPTRWDGQDGAEAVYKQMKRAKQSEKRGYVLWEPFKSKALQDPDVHVLFDSSRLSGYIVDVLVVQRQYLLDHPDVVQHVVEAYLQAQFHYRTSTESLTALVRDDAERTGAPLDAAQAQNIVDGIHWRNTLENYAHFGLVDRRQAGSVLHLEDSIANITSVLQRTGALSADPLNGEPSRLFYDGTLRALRDGDFHPGNGLGIVNDALGTAELDAVRVQSAVALSESEWDALTPVGTMQVKPLSFGRGGARLNVQSKRELEALARRLQALPNLYLSIEGRSRSDGDPEANRVLAEQRAGAALLYLSERGVSTRRMRTRTASPDATGATGASQSVAFVLSQQPY